ncbi:MAG: trypsin-like peptidase domain-containing protein [Deltaproteobacteria bacterium]|nr:trypsin-like peptidase domain-containing protein [Deltaproteobacteria bacterium]
MINTSRRKNLGISALSALALLALTAMTTTSAADSENQKKQDESRKTRPEKLHTMTVARILMRPSGDFDISIAPEELRIFLIEELRKRRYNVKGAESVLFGKDKSDQARILLGGTVRHVKCRKKPTNSIVKCAIGIDWELFDNRKDNVIYKKGTVFASYISVDPNKIDSSMYKLVMGAFAELLKEPGFNRKLRMKPEKEKPVYPAAEFRRCDIKALAVPKEMDRVLDASVVVISGNIVGSGFVISKDGIVITANHVVEESDDIKVKTKSGQTIPAVVVRSDPIHDVAVLMTSTQYNACLPIAPSAPKVGDKIYSIGAPAGEELAFSVSEGIVSALRDWKKNKFVQTDVAINPGHSGGPLVNRRGRIVAIIAWKITGMSIERLGFGVPIQLALNSLSIAPGSKTTITVNDSAGE